MLRVGAVVKLVVDLPVGLGIPKGTVGVTQQWSCHELDGRQLINSYIVFAGFESVGAFVVADKYVIEMSPPNIYDVPAGIQLPKLEGI